MTDYFLPRENTVKRIDKLCVRLFELWCEERKPVPLAYLLHCWPLTGHDPVAVKRLADAMSDLSRFQPGKLSTRESMMVHEVIGSAHEIVGEPLPHGAAAANSASTMWKRVWLANAAGHSQALAGADFLDGPL
ncbi:hypothetical protein [Paraburkholderia domus]|uniref:hypothetical protein n=1 Tax=Paraburkholderia domus TaxID=2793075 RepID=UPI001B095E40|nr:hypothetical protein [Paraburkholderia domus]CAE6773748.1 hypothetical protein R75483_04137 [Paraburkholderia domus]